MACRVGITTDPERREQEWRNKYPRLRNWGVAGPYRTREKAQQAENRLADRHGCRSHQGGRDARGPWYVYKFHY